ncbi:BlaI/MecI/CopY family transcriptional regulator [Novosphingopyxis sp.]|uniref:BlaI/MecI/CopY family transcriptional regulator n=1 Tax=Novosphingopyxis sp. TaxID=2709690 RepID=UPI003B59C31F
MDDTEAERISEAELVVLEALWAASPATATELAERVRGPREWSLATVKTLLSRLVAKRAVSTTPDGRRFQYHPLIAEAEYRGRESHRLIDRLFGGRAAPLIAHLAEREALSDDDLAEIERLLKDLRK